MDDKRQSRPEDRPRAHPALLIAFVGGFVVFVLAPAAPALLSGQAERQLTALLVVATLAYVAWLAGALVRDPRAFQSIPRLRRWAVGYGVLALVWLVEAGFDLATDDPRPWTFVFLAMTASGAGLYVLAAHRLASLDR